MPPRPSDTYQHWYHVRITEYRCLDGDTSARTGRLQRRAPTVQVPDPESWIPPLSSRRNRAGISARQSANRNATVTWRSRMAAPFRRPGQFCSGPMEDGRSHRTRVEPRVRRWCCDLQYAVTRPPSRASWGSDPAGHLRRRVLRCSGIQLNVPRQDWCGRSREWQRRHIHMTRLRSRSRPDVTRPRT